MTREIKFRIWIPYSKTMMVPKTIQTLHEEMFSGISLGQAKQWVYLLFTNTVDKKGQEIYHGHILEQDNGQKYIVEWIDQIAGFYLSIPNTHRGKEFISCAASQSDGYITLHTHEIIGNIYQHPNLINP